MDPESARLVRDEISSLRSSQRAIIICTHNLVEAESLADIIAIIHRGRLVATGTLPELKQRLLGPAEYEVELSETWNLDGAKLPPGVTLSYSDGNRLKFRVEQPSISNPLLLRELMSRQAPVVSLREVPRSLEQVYLKAMSQVHQELGDA